MKKPLIVHIIFRLDFGGLENGLVNLINNMDADRYRHAIICADDFTDFKNRIKKMDVEVYALHKKPGNDLGAYFRLWKLLRKLKPQIVHTRNLGTIEYAVPAMLAGVKYRIHGEHGRDMSDIDGTNRKYILLRRFYNKFVHCFIALSKDLEHWLLNTVKIPPNKVEQLYNGVDLSRFKVEVNHRSQPRMKSLRNQFSQLEPNDILIGTVGRLQAEKDQKTLIKAFIIALSNINNKNIKLILIGDGPDRESLELLVKKSKLTRRVLFTGSRNDIPELLSELDIFVLPSRGEGISNTILEAMASSLPVIATRVGGNPELVEDGKTGALVPSDNPEKMAESMSTYINNMDQAKNHGEAGRRRVEQQFSMESMLKNYVKVYDALLLK